MKFILAAITLVIPHSVSEVPIPSGSELAGLLTDISYP